MSEAHINEIIVRKFKSIILKMSLEEAFSLVTILENVRGTDKSLRLFLDNILHELRKLDIYPAESKCFDDDYSELYANTNSADEIRNLAANYLETYQQAQNCTVIPDPE